MKCMFCSVAIEDRAWLSRHIVTAHAEKRHARALASAIRRGRAAPDVRQSGRPLCELPIIEIDIDAIHWRFSTRRAEA